MANVKGWSRIQSKERGDVIRYWKNKNGPIVQVKRVGDKYNKSAYYSVLLFFRESGQDNMSVLKEFNDRENALTWAVRYLKTFPEAKVM